MNPVIPVSNYKERPSRGRSSFLYSDPIPVRSLLSTDNLIAQRMMSCVFRGGVLSPGHFWGVALISPWFVQPPHYSVSTTCTHLALHS